MSESQIKKIGKVFLRVHDLQLDEEDRDVILKLANQKELEHINKVIDNASYLTSEIAHTVVTDLASTVAIQKVGIEILMGYSEKLTNDNEILTEEISFLRSRLKVYEDDHSLDSIERTKREEQSKS